MTNEEAKRLVQEYGCGWVGIHKVGESTKYDLVQFNHPVTHTTLAIPRHQFNRDSLFRRLADLGGNHV